jgi:predicted metal-dependent hydrolase
MDSTETRPAARLLPDEPLPSYTYVPGRFPHPTADPAGHSFGIEPVVPPMVEPAQWQECRPYLHGIDLFNGGYYWESHVAWESLWLACGRKGVVADFLKGLIKLAATGVKALEGKPEGVRSHSGRAAELLQKVIRRLETDHDEFMGLHIKMLIALGGEIHKQGWPAKPPVLIPTLGH